MDGYMSGLSFSFLCLTVVAHERMDEWMNLAGLAGVWSRAELDDGLETRRFRGRVLSFSFLFLFLSCLDGRLDGSGLVNSLVKSTWVFLRRWCLV